MFQDNLLDSLALALWLVRMGAVSLLLAVVLVSDAVLAELALCHNKFAHLCNLPCLVRGHPCTILAKYSAYMGQGILVVESIDCHKYRLIKKEKSRKKLNRHSPVVD